ncbi:hypothetical protein X801_05031 [Opisthorchis viverrini]|uniref:Uncharacterized protein n=2 Tax=Opisthorchis viverrini TaxID=6198 RepID=A0A1S8WXB3_OPIVI|nr:hypothetical protein X801_05031 [Opisthorchis viverrini]
MLYQETQSNSALRKFALIFNRFVFCACCFSWVSVDLEKLFSKLVEEYDERRLLVEENTKYLNYVQYKLVCCGKNSVEDFQKQKPMLSCGSEPRERQFSSRLLSTTHRGFRKEY